jgi:formate dehydrogenase maturation protein FdhE
MYAVLLQLWANFRKTIRLSTCGADLAERTGGSPGCNACTAEMKYTKHSTIYMQKAPTERMHVEVCDGCKGYLKVIGAFTPKPPEMLQAEDLATLHLDYIALDYGYKRGAASSKLLVKNSFNLPNRLDACAFC